MTDKLGFQKLNICEPNGPSDIIVVKIDGDFLVGYSPYYNWVKLQEGPKDYGYTFRASNELNKYNINWNIENIYEIDKSTIGKLSLLVLSDDFTPIIVEIIDVIENDDQKSVKLKIHNQFVYNFENNDYANFDSVITWVTINFNKEDFIFDCFESIPNIQIVAKDYEIIGNFFNIPKETGEGKEELKKVIISSDTFGNIEFLIYNYPKNTKLIEMQNTKEEIPNASARIVDGDKNAILIVLNSSNGKITDDNITQLKKVLDKFVSLRKVSEEYVIKNYQKNGKINDFFIDLILRKYMSNNKSKIDQARIIDNFMTLSIEDRLKQISFIKLIITHSIGDAYDIKLLFFSGNGGANGKSLYFSYNDDYSLKDFWVEDEVIT